MNIRLIKSPTLLPIDYHGILPYGIGILAKHLRKHNHSVSLSDLQEDIWNLAKNEKNRHLQQLMRIFYYEQVTAQKYTGIHPRQNKKLAEELLNRLELTQSNAVGISISSGLEILSALLLTEIIQNT